MKKKNIIIIVIVAIILILAVYLAAKSIRKINLPPEGSLGTTTSKSTQESQLEPLPEPAAKIIPEPLPEPNMEGKNN